jgi:diguanylate cyclase (GGDEF)-like protein
VIGLSPRASVAGKRLAVTILGVTAVLAISLADRSTREDLRFGFFYLVPIGVAAWQAERRIALFIAGLSAILLIFNDLSLGVATSWPTLAFNEFTRVTTFLTLAIVLSSLRSSSLRLREESDRAFRLAVTDPLTGLYNRNFLGKQLDLASSRSKRHGRGYSILAFDVDGLKKVNDQFGHAAGDAALAALAKAVRAAVRLEDIAVRVGGDEFVVLLPDTDEDEAAIVGERLVTAVLAETRPDRVAGVSVGLATWRDGVTAEELLREADALSYESKKRGGARLVRVRDIQGERVVQRGRNGAPSYSISS